MAILNVDASAPAIKDLIKIHKPTKPTHPAVNWRNAPAFIL
jgi:hypothetical protein